MFIVVIDVKHFIVFTINIYYVCNVCMYKKTLPRLINNGGCKKNDVNLLSVLFLFIVLHLCQM